jgi:hypothetical protein
MDEKKTNKKKKKHDKILFVQGSRETVITAGQKNDKSYLSYHTRKVTFLGILCNAMANA